MTVIYSIVEQRYIERQGMVKNYILCIACFCNEAMKIVVAMTAGLNLAWFTRYEPQKLDGDDVTAVSLTRARAV